jgi:hypothetical protein
VTPGLSRGLSQNLPPPGWRAVLLSSVKRAYSALDCVLAGMVARGLGIAAICLYLDLSQAALLDRVVELDLPTPHDRPLRKPGGRNPWSLADTRQLIAWWLEGIHPDSIGERLGRSPGGVRSKARRLGLPRRDRRALVRLAPAVTAVPAPPGTRVSVTAAQRGIVAQPSASPAPWSHVSVWARREQRRAPQKDWANEERQELATRLLAHQHYLGAARDMNRTPGSVRSEATRLQLPLRERSKLVMDYDPVLGRKIAEENLKAASYLRRICNVTGRLFYSSRGGDRTSETAKKTRPGQC